MKNLSNLPSEHPDRWLEEHGDYLYRYALVRVRKPEIAEDIVQETFLGALRSFKNFGGRSSLRSWFCSILKNKVTDYYRDLGRENSPVDLEFCKNEFDEKFVTEGDWFHVDGPEDWKPPVDEVMHRDEFWETMRACLGKLPQRIANVFMLREMDEIPSKDLCKMLSISESNLWVMLHRARMALRECLEKNWFTDKSGEK